MTPQPALARVEREVVRAASARSALAARAAPLTRLAGRVHPLALVGAALAAGLLAGRLFGRPHLPRALAPAALISGALQKSLVGLVGTFVSAALTPPRVSDDSTADSPPGTQSRAP
ncbi:MAG: hypothetical protein WEF50_08525 [Myxococcota bacterium]